VMRNTTSCLRSRAVAGEMVTGQFGVVQWAKLRCSIFWDFERFDFFDGAEVLHEFGFALD
jgi:hypothetical protein